MLLFLFSACRKDVDRVNTTTTTPDPTIIDSWTQDVNNVPGSVIGFVVDENDEPVTDVSIKMGNNTVTTDAFGHFIFTDVTLNTLGTYVTADKAGFFQGSRRFFPIEDRQNRVKIQLLEKSFDQTMDSQTGGTINIGTNNEASVSFTGNGFILSNGDPYTGTVHVASKFLDPTSIATFDQMPGNLQGVNTISEEVVLGTYGMIALEMEGDNGEPLNIKPENAATVNVKLADELLSNAPSIIPLWFFDEAVGMWVQEGEAELIDGAYVGKVEHFTFWNCDAPFPLVEMTLQVSAGNQPLGNVKVQLEIINSNNGWASVSCGYTDANGEVSGKVPVNEELAMTVYDYCNNVIMNAVVGPFSVTDNFTAVVAPANTVSTSTFSGTLIDCNGDQITNGAVLINEGNQTFYHYPSDANFSIDLVTCNIGAPAEVIGVNMTDLLQSNPVTATTGTINDLGNISVCDVQVENYISITFNGDTAIFLDAQYTSWSQGGTDLFTQDSLQTGNQVYIGFGGNTVGDYSTDNFLEVIQSSDNGWFITPDFQVADFSSFEVTEYGPNIIGTFSGEVTSMDAAGNTITGPCTGEFNITQ